MHTDAPARLAGHFSIALRLERNLAHTAGIEEVRPLRPLADGTLDLALVATAPKPGGPSLTVAPLFSDPFVLATAPGDAPAGPVPLRELDTASLLLLNEGHCFRDQAIAACSLSDGEASRAFAATSLSTIVEFVANGLGITLLPAIAVRKEAPPMRSSTQPTRSAGASLALPV